MAGRLATAIGIVTMLCALFGLFYNAQGIAVSLSGGFEGLVREHKMTHFYAAFYAMSAICVVCYLILFWGGYQLARRRFSVSWLLISAWLFEIVYFLVIGLTWRIPDVGGSIAGATGVANGGLMAQFFILLPFWGPLAIFWVKRRHASPSAI